MADRPPTKLEISASIDTLLASVTANTDGSHYNIPASETSGKCCCGREDCAYLKYNTAALDGLEHKLRTAAGLGQALLVRHEQYILDAEHERSQMGERISKLEDEKKTLELENKRTIAENRGLLDQLEDLNATATESEAHVKSLEATLHSAQQELKRLDVLAARAVRLEIHVAELESEQNVWQTQVSKTKEDERSAIRRWQQAERELSYLENQLDTIEREAKEERERHAEILARMERQRAMQKELDAAAVRLKGAAAVTTTGKSGNNVVSHFVKDILQDNTNLQLGIMELKQLLSNSNDEVQHLRGRLMEHQPMIEGVDQENLRTLEDELTPKGSLVNPELHIHHHYHPVARPVLKKKRVLINTGPSTPTPGTPKHRGRGYRMEDPRTPRNSDARQNSDFMHPAPPSAAATILSQTSITVPSTPAHGDHRWSLQTMSEFAPSSAPSSPGGSMYRNSMLFDMGSRAGFYGDEGSRPTSPGSSVDGFISPSFNGHQRKRGSDMSGRSFTVPTAFTGDFAIQEEGDDDRTADVDELRGLAGDTTASRKTGQHSSASTDSNNLDTTTEGENEHESPVSPGSQDQDHVHHNTKFTQPRLCRTTSHESIISISGLDIHTLKSQPHQIEFGNARSPYRRRRGDDSSSKTIPTPSLVSSTIKATGPVISASDATAVGIAADGYGLGFGPGKHGSARRVNSTAYLREHFIAAEQRASVSSRGSTGSESEHRNGVGGIGKKVGGWISSRWGVSPAPSHSSSASASREGLRAHLDVADNLTASSRASVNSLQSSTSANSGSVRSSDSAKPPPPTMAMLMGRPPGVNQKGPVPGWSAKKREPVPFQVEPESVNMEGLTSALLEE